MEENKFEENVSFKGRSLEVVWPVHDDFLNWATVQTSQWMGTAPQTQKLLSPYFSLESLTNHENEYSKFKLELLCRGNIVQISPVSPYGDYLNIGTYQQLRLYIEKLDGGLHLIEYSKFPCVVSLDDWRKQSIVLLPEGKLKLRCKLYCLGQESLGINLILGNKLIDFNMDEVTVEHTDFTIEVTSEENASEVLKAFKVHKIILCSKSDVFKAMLSSNMKETYQHKMILKGVQPQTVGSMLNYIYSGNFNHESVNEELLDLAEKYQLWTLKAVCEKEFLKKINLDNLIHSWNLLKGKYNCSSPTKEKMVQFAIKNWQEIRDSHIDVFKSDIGIAMLDSSCSQEVYDDLDSDSE